MLLNRSGGPRLRIFQQKSVKDGQYQWRDIVRRMDSQFLFLKPSPPSDVTPPSNVMASLTKIPVRQASSQTWSPAAAKDLSGIAPAPTCDWLPASKKVVPKNQCLGRESCACKSLLRPPIDPLAAVVRSSQKQSRIGPRQERSGSRLPTGVTPPMNFPPVSVSLRKGPPSRNILAQGSIVIWY